MAWNATLTGIRDLLSDLFTGLTLKSWRSEVVAGRRPTEAEWHQDNASPNTVKT